VKSIEDAALGMASIYRAVGLPLPTRMPIANEATLREFATNCSPSSCRSRW
jgi:ATP-dependent helicase HrpA